MGAIETISMTDFLAKNKAEIRKSLDYVMKPTFEGLSNPQKYTREIDRLTLLPKIPFPRQARAIVAGYEHLKKNKSLILSAEMGTGKTLMAISMAFLRMSNQKDKQMNFGVMCPTHLMKKWCEEIMDVLGDNAKDVEIFLVEKGTDMLRLAKQENRKRVRFYVFSKETAKLSYELTEERKPFLRAYRVDTETEYVCPECGTRYEEKVVDEWIKKSQAKVRSQEVALMSNRKPRKKISWEEICEARGRTNKAGETTKVSFCRKCRIQSNLIQRNDGLRRYLSGESSKDTKGSRQKISIAQAIKSQNTKGFFEVLFVDEMHEMKGGDTAQGLAFATLTGSSKKVVGLTGTLLNGYVSSLFYVLFRMFPKTMIDMGFSYSQEKSFIEKFGGYQSKRQMTRDDQTEANEKSGAFSKKFDKHGIQPKEIPVINPKLIAFLMPNTIFLKQDELNVELPEYEEKVILTKPDPNKEYDEYIRELRHIVKNEFNPASRKLLGAYLNDSLSILDLPYLPKTAHCEDEHAGVLAHVEYRPSIKEDYITNKERQLYALVLSELQEKRRVLIYVNFSGLGTSERVKSVLERLFRNSGTEYRPKIQILSSNIEAKKRNKWIEENPSEILITNPELVKTGLDLYDYPTIIYHQTGYVIQTIKQASRRAWRIGQKQKCKVFFLATEGTAQRVALSLTARKLKASNDLEGKILLTQNELTAMITSHTSMEKAMIETLTNKEEANIQDDDLTTWRFKKREDDEFEAFFKVRFEKFKMLHEAKTKEMQAGKSELAGKLETSINKTIHLDESESEAATLTQEYKEKVISQIAETAMKEEKKPSKAERKGAKNIATTPNLFEFFGVEL